jgi:preprotein translocase subunit YajC
MILNAQPAQGGGGMGMLIMMLLIFVIMWFFMIRPQQKRQKAIRAFQNSIERGSKVVTGGGVYGTVKNVDQATGKVEVEVANNVVVTVDKNYVFAAVQDMQAK